MYDNDIYKALAPAIAAGFALFNGPEVQIVQNYQPTTQGIDSGPTIYINKTPGDRRYGWPKREDVWNVDAYTHTETQDYESTFQINGVFRQTAEDTDGLTASDLTNLCAAALQHDVIMAQLLAAGLSVLRVTTVRNVPFVNGEGEFEENPSFDLVLKHNQVTVTITPVAEVTELNIRRV